MVHSSSQKLSSLDPDDGVTPKATSLSEVPARHAIHGGPQATKWAFRLKMRRPARPRLSLQILGHEGRDAEGLQANGT